MFVVFFSRRATTAAASRPEASSGRLSGRLGSGSCLAPQEHSLDPKLSAPQQIDHKRLPKQHQNSKYNQQ